MNNLDMCTPLVTSACKWISLTGIPFMVSQSAIGMGDSSVFYLNDENSVAFVAIVSNSSPDSSTVTPSFYGANAISALETASVVEIVSNLYEGLCLDISPEMDALVDQAVQNQKVELERRPEEFGSWADQIVADVNEIKD